MGIRQSPPGARQSSVGMHLPFYLLHQPVILGVLELVYSVR